MSHALAHEYVHTVRRLAQQLQRPVDARATPLGAGAYRVEVTRGYGSPWLVATTWTAAMHLLHQALG